MSEIYNVDYEIGADTVFSSEAIAEIVKRLRGHAEKGALSEQQLKRQFSEFYLRFPMLFEKAIDLQFSLEYLDWMLKCSTSVTKDNVNDWDETVYGKLKEEFKVDG